MSRDIVRINERGVILRYADPGARRQHHVERRAQHSDEQRVAVLKAERALIVLEVITECADLSDAALDRIDDALQDIYDALQLKRRQFGMYTDAGGA
jgi:hypothetical protein